MNENQELNPTLEFPTEDGYRWIVYHESDTGLPLIGLADLDTGVTTTTIIPRLGKRVAAHRAWAGARQSRAPGTPWEIMHEMEERGVNPDQKLEEMFRTYGHASVGDMARLQVDISGGPMHLNLAVFQESGINSGQEKSTRYQSRFGRSALHGLRHYLPSEFPQDELERLEAEYQKFGGLSLDLFTKHRDLLTTAFTDFYQPQNQGEISSLNSRVLDCVRYFLLLGFGSGMSFETSARDWSRIIGEMKAAPLQFYGKVASQMERLLSPSPTEEIMLGAKAEAPGLIRHADAALLTNNNIAELRKYALDKSDFLQRVVFEPSHGRVDQEVELLSREYSEGDRLVVQYMLLIFPGLNAHQLLDWVHGQETEAKKTISQIIFAGHDNYREMPIWAGTTMQTLRMHTFLGELRDFNRHRAWRRFIPMPLVFGEAWTSETATQVLNRGFGLPLYLTDNPQFSNQGKAFEADLARYYDNLFRFVSKTERDYGRTIDYAWVINLLPLAHQMDMWMHGDPKQSLYLTHQRTRNGGHINYRALAYGANQLLVSSDPYLSGMRLEKKPDPASRIEFFDRS